MGYNYLIPDGKKHVHQSRDYLTISESTTRQVRLITITTNDNNDSLGDSPNNDSLRDHISFGKGLLVLL